MRKCRTRRSRYHRAAMSGAMADQDRKRTLAYAAWVVEGIVLVNVPRGPVLSFT